jgi:hypothetical protein
MTGATKFADRTIADDHWPSPSSPRGVDIVYWHAFDRPEQQVSRVCGAEAWGRKSLGAQKLGGAKAWGRRASRHSGGVLRRSAVDSGYTRARAYHVVGGLQPTGTGYPSYLQSAWRTDSSEVMACSTTRRHYRGLPAQIAQMQQ